MKLTKNWVYAVFANGLLFWVTQATAGGILFVDGYFCDSRDAQLAFTHKLAGGENEITASNVVNKSFGRSACLPFHLATAILASEENVIDKGVTVVLRSFRFLPENTERWHSTLSGSLAPTADKAI